MTKAIDGSRGQATRTASAPSAARRVAGGSAWPERVSASAATVACCSSSVKWCRRETAASTWLASAISSGPTPSPERHAIGVVAAAHGRAFFVVGVVVPVKALSSCCVGVRSRGALLASNRWACAPERVSEISPLEGDDDDDEENDEAAERGACEM